MNQGNFIDIKGAINTKNGFTTIQLSLERPEVDEVQPAALAMCLSKEQQQKRQQGLW